MRDGFYGAAPHAPTMEKGIYARLRLAIRPCGDCIWGFAPCPNRGGINPTSRSYFGKKNPKDPKKPKKGKWKRRGKATECMSVQIFCRRGRIERCPTPRRETLLPGLRAPRPDIGKRAYARLRLALRLGFFFGKKNPKNPKKPENVKGKRQCRETECLSVRTFCKL